MINNFSIQLCVHQCIHKIQDAIHKLSTGSTFSERFYEKVSLP